MFDFITNVVNEKNPYYSYKEIENIAHSDKEEKYLKLIYRIINYYKIKNVLFIGQDKDTKQLLELQDHPYRGKGDVADGKVDGAGTLW